jgi:hypothetical protein
MHLHGDRDRPGRFQSASRRLSLMPSAGEDARAPQSIIVKGPVATSVDSTAAMPHL